MLSREPYQGSSRELVVAFDVGTTYSGVSYAILDPGEIPKIQSVTKYPGQEHTGSVCRIPSLVYYDQCGTPRAFGEEALQDHVIEQAHDEQWVKLEWWKLHLHAKHPVVSHIAGDELPPIPFGKSAVDVLADFMRYLFRCAQKYIEDSHGIDLWKSVENHIQYVLTHPSEWEGPQQEQVRRAATLAGLVSSSPESQARVHLLTEGEASLHFCVSNTEALSRIPSISPEHHGQEEEQPRQQGVVIIDAGGGTINLSAYSMKLSPASFEEIAPAECRLQGSVFVTRRATALLRRRLEGSEYCSPEILEEMTENFDKTTKLLVRNAEDPQYIRLGSRRLQDSQYDIRFGKLRLSGAIVVELFDPSIREIIDGFVKQREASSIPITSVFLVGGFAASDWLFSSLRGYFEQQDISLFRLDSYQNKAVADGAISYQIDHLVSKDTRVAEEQQSQEAGSIHRSSQVIFLLMGPTGSGKTNFINKLTGTSGVGGSASLNDGTRNVTRHVVECDGRDLVFVDTPGLDNTYLPDAAIFKLVAEWLDTNYPSNTEVEIIYFHRITDNRIQGSPQKYLKMLRGQCGRVAVRQILCLVTTMWDEVDDTKEAERREQFLKDEFQRKNVCALFKRFDNQRSSALDIARSLMGNKGRRPRKLISRTRDSDESRVERQFQRLISNQRNLLSQAATEGNAPRVQTLQADLDALEAQMKLLFQAMRERNISLLSRVLQWFKARAAAANIPP